MPRPTPAIPLIALALVATVLATRAPGVEAESPTTVPVRAVAADPSPGSRMEGEAALRDATAAAVAAALVAQFPGQQVELQLHALEASAVSIRDREVHGNGRLRFGDDEAWLPFGYRALYDTQAGVALSPRLTLGAGGAEAAGAGEPLDAALAARFDDEAARRVAGEFDGQPVRLTIESAQGRALSARYLRIDAAATADFGREGRTPARIGAVYDRREASWLQFAYELGPSATASAPVLGADTAAAGGEVAASR